MATGHDCGHDSHSAAQHSAEPASSPDTQSSEKKISQLRDEAWGLFGDDDKVSSGAKFRGITINISE